MLKMVQNESYVIWITCRGFQLSRLFLCYSQSVESQSFSQGVNVCVCVCVCGKGGGGAGLLGGVLARVEYPVILMNLNLNLSNQKYD